MQLTLVLLVGIAAASVVIAAYVYIAERSRRELVARTAGRSARGEGVAAIPLRDTTPGITAGVLKWVQGWWTADAKIEQALVQAGFDDPLAPLVYGAARLVGAAVFALLAVVLAPKDQFTVFASSVAAATACGFLAPTWYVGYAQSSRQARVRRSLPDALDLLVICIEAGTSLDAALLRVAKDLGGVHPDLARELLVVNRQTNAGMARSDALNGLWERTGVNEVRTLVSHIIQGEKWGTSSGRVLRVYAETLRRQRRQVAERKAATAPVKMLLPLGLFIFPAILLVIMGPVVLTVREMFKQ